MIPLHKTVDFPRKTMLEVLETGNVISDTIVGGRRWSLLHELVFEYEGTLYRTHYSVGATEMQDEGPWEYARIVRCTVVEAYEKTVTAYRPVSVEAP